MAGGYQPPISDEVKERAIALYMAGNTKNMIATQLKLSWATVNKIVAQYQPEVEAARADNRKELVASSMATAQIYLEKLCDPETVKKTKPRDAAVIYGILMDKAHKEQEIELNFNTMREIALSEIIGMLRADLYDDPDLLNALTARVIQLEEKSKLVFERKIGSMLDSYKRALRTRIDTDKDIDFRNSTSINIAGYDIPTESFKSYVSSMSEGSFYSFFEFLSEIRSA